jgi:hypothetical protein
LLAQAGGIFLAGRQWEDFSFFPDKRNFFSKNYFFLVGGVVR